MMKSQKKISLTLLASLIGAGVCAFPAFAQQNGPQEKYRGVSAFKQQSSQSAKENYDVRDRLRPEYDAQGVSAGAFRLFPELKISEQYDDNIFLSSKNEETDFITTVAPGIAVRSDFSRHALNFKAGADANFYGDNNDENHENYFGAFDGRLDATDNFNLTFGAGHGIYSEDRTLTQGIGANTSGGERVEFDQTDLDVALNGRMNRFRSTLGYAFQVADFDDTTAFSDDDNIDQDFRDYQSHSIFGRTNYDFSPGYSAFVEGIYTEKAFDSSGGGQIERDSKNYGVYVGGEAELTNLITGEVKAGYLESFYEDGAYEDVNGFGYGGAINWYPTPMLTTRFSAARQIDDAGVPGVSGVLHDIFSLEADYELRRNIIVSPYLAYDIRRFDEALETYGAGIKGDYLINNNFSLNIGYGYTQRTTDTNVPSFTQYEFKRNLISAGFKAKL